MATQVQPRRLFTLHHIQECDLFAIYAHARGPAVRLRRYPLFLVAQ
jgi:hypothetical protein